MPGNNMPLWWRRRPTEPATGNARRIVVVTDLDASLHEPGTRQLPDGRAALDFLAARGIPLVINSSRTRAEIERLHQTLQLLTPFITEHGSALFLPHGSFPNVPERARPAVGGHVIEFGQRYHQVVDGLRLTCDELAVQICGFAELSIEDVARELDVPIVEAQLAKLREYTELFRIIEETDTVRSRLFKALRRRGLRCCRTSTHHLVTATPDRTESLRILRTMWKETWGDPLIVGLGESEDDVAWLQHTDVAIIIPDDHAGVPARVLSKMPTVRVTRSAGRHGWSEAVFEFVGALVTPPVCEKSVSESANREAAGADHQPP